MAYLTYSQFSDAEHVRYAGCMKRLFMRAGKTPFETSGGYETFDRNLIGNNNGNLIFAAAAHKLVSVTDTRVDALGYSVRANQAAMVNDESDGFVLPLANAFRPSWEGALRNLTAFIRELRVPFIMLSGGAQSGKDGSYDHLRPMEDSIRAFCSAVLDKSSHITVRGERTAAYLRSLGFADVLVIGCPSMTMNGPGHNVQNASYSPDARIAYNVETSKDIMAEIVDLVDKNYRSHYFPQDIGTLEMMLWGVDKFAIGRERRLPLNPGHSQFKNNRARFVLDATTWISEMRGYDLAFGARIHGNIAAVLAGTPSVVFAHDSRTLEIAEYHDIPHFNPEEIPAVKTLEEVFERADFTQFNEGHTAKFNKVTEFMRINGFDNIYDVTHAEALAAYTSNLAKVDFPPTQTTVWSTMDEVQAARLRRDRVREVASATAISELRKEVRRLRALG